MFWGWYKCYLLYFTNKYSETLNGKIRICSQIFQIQSLNSQAVQTAFYWLLLSIYVKSTFTMEDRKQASLNEFFGK